MSSFPAVNDPGAYFEAQIVRKDFDPFACLGLHADLDQLSMTGVRYHFRKEVVKHVFEAPNRMQTKGPRVPTWSHCNQAKQMLLGGNKRDFERLKTAWKYRSVQVWNPFAAVGSAEAKMSRVGRTGMQSPCLWQINTDRVLHAVPAKYFQPDVEEVPDEHFQQRPGRAGYATAEDPFQTAGNPGTGSGTQRNPFWFPESDDEESTAGSYPRTPRTPHTPRMPSPPPLPSRNPASSSRQRIKPKGILLGTWARAGVHADQSPNAVYGSRDRLNRINRRIAKVDIVGEVVLGGFFDAKRTACKHDHIDYLPAY